MVPSADPALHLTASLAGAAPLLSTLYSHLEGSSNSGSSSASRRRGASSRRRGTSAASEDQNTVVASLLETLGVSNGLSRSIVDAVIAADGSGLGAGAEEWMQRIAAEIGGGDAVPRTGSGGPAYNTRSQQRSRRGRGSSSGRGSSRSRSETPRDEGEGLAGQMLRGLFRRFADEINR